eukprot:Platyproteum_vivax@DN7342_c0_g1_i1.p1
MFLNSGDVEIDKRELAAFLSQIAQETTGAGLTGACRSTWGLCFREEVSCSPNGCLGSYRTKHDACINIHGYSCLPVPGKSYHGRGAIQISWNYNYAQFSKYMYNDPSILLNEPEKVLESGVTGFSTGLWFWVTPQSPKPSCHNVITNRWTPTPADRAGGRVPGFGMTTNVINGGLECNKGFNQKQENRVRNFRFFSRSMGVATGPALSCARMTHY